MTRSSSIPPTRNSSRRHPQRLRAQGALPAVGGKAVPAPAGAQRRARRGKAARDWPKLNFIIYHGGYRYAGGGTAQDAWAQFEQDGRIDWVTDLAEIPQKFGVTNVYADVGQLFAQSTIADPRVSAVMMGQLVKGMGADHVCWGTDAIWTGSPQWQIEALRRLEISEDIRAKYRLDPLGPADGPVKRAIFGGNNARLYDFKPSQQAALAGDGIAEAAAVYAKHGAGRTNLAYGYARR
jgi:predicted TIM-barrel fold metal-dependent hydrolase